MADRVLVQMLLGGAYRDVTDGVYTRDGIRITRGGGSFSQHVDPASCSLTLNNTGGVYSPRNPRSPWFGTFGRNTPLRVWARGPYPYLRIPGNLGARGRTASSPSLDVTGDLDVRIDVSLDRLPQLSSTYRPQVNELVARWNTTGSPGNRSWLLLLDSLGQPTLGWSTTGDDYVEQFSEDPVPFVSGQRFALRAVLDVDNGAGGHTVTFYTAPTLAGPWTQLGPSRTGAGVTSINSPGDASLEIGEINTVAFAPGTGRYYGMELRDGIDGPLLASADFTTQEHGAREFTDGQGNLWEVTGIAEVTHFYRRFHGEVSEWPARWHVSGNDVYKPIQAAGLLRRLGQGQAPLKSTLRRRIPGGADGQPAPRAYWPMEEGRDATQAYSPIEGVAPLRTSGLNWASDSSLFGSDALPTLGQSASISGAPGAGTTQLDGWSLDLSFRLEELPSATEEMVSVWLGGTGMARAATLIDSSGVEIAIYDGEGAKISGVKATDPDSLAAFVGNWNRLQMHSAVSGDQTYVVTSWRNVITGFRYFAAVIHEGGPGDLYKVSADWGDGVSGMAIGHLGIWGVGGTITHDPLNPDPGITYFDDADDAFEGERARSRIRRLAEEEDLELIATGVFADSLPMGPQQIATVLENVQDCADVDGGLLIEQRETLGLAYLGRDVFYNPTPGLVLDYTARGEVMPPLAPVDDDTILLNDVTVSRIGGSSARAVLDEGPLSVQAPPGGAGVYDTSVQVNAASDDQLPSLAHWRLHLGTVDEARYPQVTVDLMAAPHLMESVLSLDIGSTIRLTNLPEWLPPGDVDLRIEGWTETLNEFEWRITFNCSPGSPWVVGQVAAEDGTDGTDQPNRVDTDLSETALDVTDSATQILVHTPDVQWVTDSADFPVDVAVGGEVVRATAIDPAGTDTFSRDVTDGWGTSAGGLVWTTSGGSPTDFSVDSVSGKGRIHLAATPSTLRFAEVVEAWRDAEQVVTWSVDQLPAAGVFLPGLIFRAGTLDGSTALYWLNLSMGPDGSLSVELRDVTTPVDSAALSSTYAPGTGVHLRGRIDGQRVRGKAWVAGTTEPDWQVDHVMPNGGIPEGSIGLAVASTDSSTPMFMVDDYQIVTPQLFTVQRGINGLTKAHAAGTDVRLAQPTVVAL